MSTYMTPQQLSEKLGFSVRYLNKIKKYYFVEGKHYVRPFGGSIRFIWEEVEIEINKRAKPEGEVIPMARGGVCYG